LKARFFRHAADRGFVIDERNHPRSTTFRRSRDGRVDIFEVQWDKYGKPRFAVHFGACAAEGLRINDKLFSPDETFPTWCPDAGTLQPRKGTSSRSWFRQDTRFFQRLLGRSALRDPEHVVGELLAIFPELERYWSTGEIGPHMRLLRLMAPPR
jgi:hypothetical protein